jgi:hypothetical protein
MSRSSVFGDGDGASRTRLGASPGGIFLSSGYLADEALASAEALVIGLEDRRAHGVATAVADALLAVDEDAHPSSSVR